jgi:hypothetical protein
MYKSSLRHIHDPVLSSLKMKGMCFFNYALQPFKAYCASWVRRSNFRHQASPRVSPRESTPAAEGETVSEKCPEILPKYRVSSYI